MPEGVTAVESGEKEPRRILPTHPGFMSQHDFLYYYPEVTGRTERFPAKRDISFYIGKAKSLRAEAPFVPNLADCAQEIGTFDSWWGKHFTTEAEITDGFARELPHPLQCKGLMYELVRTSFEDSRALLALGKKAINAESPEWQTGGHETIDELMQLRSADKDAYSRQLSENPQFLVLRQLARLIAEDEKVYEDFARQCPDLITILGQDTETTTLQQQAYSDARFHERIKERNIRGAFAWAVSDIDYDHFGEVLHSVSDYAEQVRQNWTRKNWGLNMYANWIARSRSNNGQLDVYQTVNGLLAGVPVRNSEYVSKLLAIMRREKLTQSLNPLEMDGYMLQYEPAYQSVLPADHFGFRDDEHKRLVTEALVGVTQIPEEEILPIQLYLPNGESIVTGTPMNARVALEHYLVFCEAVPDPKRRRQIREIFRIPEPETDFLVTREFLYDEQTGTIKSGIINQIPDTIIEHIGRYWSYFNYTLEPSRR